MKLKWILYRLRTALGQDLGVGCKKSYSQCGEDLIVRHIFDALKIPAPSYLDIGAHDPAYLNNTRIFYDVGARGVNVEPDPALIARFRSERKKDINLNIGIADTEGTLPFYLMNPPTLNTFVKSEAEAAVAGGDGRIVIESVNWKQ